MPNEQVRILWSLPRHRRTVPQSRNDKPRVPRGGGADSKRKTMTTPTTQCILIGLSVLCMLCSYMLMKFLFRVLNGIEREHERRGKAMYDALGPCGQWYLKNVILGKDRK